MKKKPRCKGLPTRPVSRFFSSPRHFFKKKINDMSSANSIFSHQIGRWKIDVGVFSPKNTYVTSKN
jgi:hypothetical protein